MGCRVRKCRWNARSVHISEIQHVTFGRGFLSEKSLKKVHKKFGEELKSRTFALPLKNGRAARPVVLEKTDAERFSKKSSEKIWKFENNAYLCRPVRETGPRERV